MPSDVGSITSDSAHQRWSQGTEKEQADKVKSGLGGRTTLVHGTTFLIKYINLNPVEHRAVAGAPPHVAYIKDASIFQDRPAVTHCNRSRYAYHSGGVEIFRLDPYERKRGLDHLRSHSASDGIRHAGHAGEKEPKR